MTRIDDRGTEYCALRAACEAAGVKPTYRRARCQHGYTSDQTCVECENGYVDDTHRFANLPEVATLFLPAQPVTGTYHLFALSDDHDDVICVSESRLDQLKRRDTQAFARFCRVLTEKQISLHEEMQRLRASLGNHRSPFGPGA